jgi:ATP-dependent Clp protease ATP-binding subunit ClpA
MFERYTETARRTIFFARYEASAFGSSQIETEHLLLGLFREDKALANQLLGSFAKLEEIRHAIERKSIIGPKVPTSVDLPLSHESKRALAYAAEESQRLNHNHIGTGHLLLGLLREEKSFAAQLMRERGVTVESVRKQVDQSGQALAQGRSISVAGLNRWVAERQAEGGIWTIEQRGAGACTTHFALYAGDEPKTNSEGEDLSPAEKVAQTQKRIDLIIRRMENAIANHEFEKVRLYSDEERKEREHLRGLCEQYNLEAPRVSRVPRLCIAVIGNDLFTELRERCEVYIAEGAAEVWLLDSGMKRAYTVTKADGLREFKGDTLRFASPPLEMELGRIFD